MKADDREQPAFFSRHEPSFTRFLSLVGRQSTPDHRSFVGRNFLLDEGIPEARGNTYSEYLTMLQTPSHFTRWLQEHSEYLEEEVFLPQPASGPPRSIDPAKPSSCPATFKESAAFRAFGSADLDLDLLRLISLQELETAASPLQLSDLVEIADQVVAGDPEQTQLFDGILTQWSSHLQLRPVFAAFWEDLKHHFGTHPDQDDLDWADAIRNRLGLLYLDPPTRRPEGIPILAFRYPVREVPRRIGSRNRRPLVPPTVLDTGFNAAFCPAPRDEPWGRVIDLTANLERPCREVLHPFFPFRARHLFRVGTVRAPIPEDLAEARLAHILYLREMSARADFAVVTDPEGP